VSDLEFVQFHPTVLDAPGAPRFLLSEALRGEGARLVNQSGEPIMSRYDPAGDLAPRDVVATAIVREQQRTGSRVYLTLAHLAADRIRNRFPMIADACAAAGLDVTRDPLPVSPAAHYMCGGVDTDLDGRTSVSGLFAAGEVACTRIHGANRLASNSLLEGLVFGARAAAAMRLPLSDAKLPDAVAARPWTRSAAPGEAVRPEDVPDVLWSVGGLIRDGEGLARGLAALEPLLEPQRHERLPDTVSEAQQQSVALVGSLILRAALRREESRGGHRRAEFASRDDVHWRVHVAETAPPNNQS
jgi:L-aspartate oxidase